MRTPALFFALVLIVLAASLTIGCSLYSGCAVLADLGAQKLSSPADATPCQEATDDPTPPTLWFDKRCPPLLSSSPPPRFALTAQRA